MFRAIITPIFRSTRLCVTVCGIMHPRCCRSASSWVRYTASCKCSAPEDGRNYRPKHVELIGIINKLLLLHLVGCIYIIYINDARSSKRQIYRHLHLSGYKSIILWFLSTANHVISSSHLMAKLLAYKSGRSSAWELVIKLLMEIFSLR